MTVQSYFKNLRFLQVILLTGYVMAIAICFVLYSMELIPLINEAQNNSIIDVLAIATTFAGVISSFFLFQILLVRVDEKLPLGRKLSAFKSAYFLRLAIIEGVGMIGVVLFMISQSIIAITSSIIIAVLIGLLKPSKKEMGKVLRLNPTELAQISSKQTALANIDQDIFRNRMN